MTIAAQPRETIQETPFYVAATGIGNRRQCSLKYGDTFLVMDNYGDVGAAEGGPDGLFHNDTRFLSRLELTVNELPPLLLGSTVRDDNSVLTVDLTNPDIFQDKFHDKRLVLQKDTLHIVRTTFLWRGTAYQRIGIRNHGSLPVDLRIAFRFGSDFADLFEVRGLKRERRGATRRPSITSHQVLLNYHGLDGTTRRTAISFDPPPARLSEGEAHYQCILPPHDITRIFIAIGCDTTEGGKISFARALIGAHRERRAAASGGASVESSNALLNEVLCRSSADLAMLMTETPHGRYPYAGIPWYSTTFGRDGIITALQMLWLEPDIARGVLRRLAFFQAKTVDPAADAQPGKILHETRAGEMAVLGEVPFRLYYGTVDATPLFVLLAGAYLDRTGDRQTIVELWPSIEAALSWIDRYGDADGDGFVEYRRATEQGLANQGWKDSFDAIFRADGSLVEGDVALAEVQGYVFAAKLAAARCARQVGRNERAAALEQQASATRRTLRKSLLVSGAQQLCAGARRQQGAMPRPGLQCRTSAVQRHRQSRACRKGRRHAARAAVLFRLGHPHRGKGAARYNPMSYHNGSVWPHDNALIALGFARYGLKSAVTQLFKGLFDAATYMELRRLPELFCGFKRQANRGPTLYPVACSPQAWASATPFTLLEASLGLEFDPANSEIRLRNPRLPEFIDDVLLRNLRLGEASVDLRVRRVKDKVTLDIVRSQGKMQVSVLLSV